MSRNIPRSLSRTRRPAALLFVLAVLIVLALVAAFFAFRFLRGPSTRWAQFSAFQLNPELLAEVTLQPGQRCGQAPFAFPTTGVIFGLWDQSYRFGHRHQGLDIFAGTRPGVTPVYAVYPGFLSRLADWRASLIIRIPEDPLQPNRQIWTYYTHLADEDGNSYVAAAFPPGTKELFVEAGTFLGYQGNFSGDPVNPTGLHLHFSIVSDDGEGNFLNELDIENTYDPTPYFNLPLNHQDNSKTFPTCSQSVSVEDWPLVPDNE